MVARSPRATIIEPVCTATGLSPRARRGKRLRVLLVEPDERYRSSLGTKLAEAGFEVVVVPTAEDAREELAASPTLPHLVVAETELAGMDGFSLCNQLRAELRTAELPVFLISSRREKFHPELAASVGADDYLAKPVMAEDVVALARLKAGRRSTEPEYEAHSARLPLTDMVRALLAGTRSGRVVLKEGDGFFAFRDGRVVDAGYLGERGVLAFRRLLSFGSGVYGVTFGPELHRGTLLMDLAFLRHQVLPGLERFARLREVGVPLAARLTVDFQRLAEQLAKLPDEVISLVRLFDGRRTVRMVLLECRLTEVVALETVMHLFVLGVLGPACHVEERERVQTAPRFFEPETEALRVARAQEAHDAEQRAADEHEARLNPVEETAAQAPEEEPTELEVSLADAAEAQAPVEAEAPKAEAQAPVEAEAPKAEAQAPAEVQAPVEAQASAPVEAPAQPQGDTAQAAAEADLEDVEIVVEPEPSAEELISRMPIPVILFHPKQKARRRDDEKAARAH
ncbi:response regulator [Hyalangium versicolor]|uniref:response regulator n=1 Tax=Hyalangium versicolor TaxID=2861190 RepID=UPI001CC9CFE6|nr:response regulator [Hyalangium versicolor]